MSHLPVSSNQGRVQCFIVIADSTSAERDTEYMWQERKRCPLSNSEAFIGRDGTAWEED